MNICVFDTETISLTKPFCYNFGFIILDTEKGVILEKRDYIIEQIWHNTALFTTAYYAEKRQIYVNAMRSRQTTLKKWGYVMQTVLALFNKYEVAAAFAYNSPFDIKVMEFNSDWYKTINPFEELPIFDIRGYVHNYIAFDENYTDFCIENSFFTESGNISTTAETVYRYLSNNLSFLEEHTALSDSIIETDILIETINQGAEWNKEYKVYASIPYKKERTLKINTFDNQVFTFPYYKNRIKKDNDGMEITLK